MSKLKLALIAHNCRAGGGRFGTLNLLQAMASVADHHKFLLIHPAHCGYEDIKLPEGSEYCRYEGSHSPLKRLWYERKALPQIVDDFDPDIIFGVGNSGLIHPKVPQVLFIRQAHLLYKQSEHNSKVPFMLKLRLWELHRQIKKSIPKTNLIFTQTPVVGERVCKVFDYPQDKICVLRLPPPKDISFDANLEKPKIFQNNPEAFHFLLLTRYLPHRNPSILIPLCKQYAATFRERNIRFIVTLDREYPLSQQFLAEVRLNDFEDLIIDAGEIPRDEVGQYYGYSNILWMPTMLETLGFPFLEAMSNKLPILVPDLDFSRYICGKAAAYYNPDNLQSLFEIILKLQTDTKYYKELKNSTSKELQNRNKFAQDWHEVANDALDALNKVVDRKK